MNNYLEAERPATSFTQKRHVRTQQGDRQQINLAQFSNDHTRSQVVKTSFNVRPGTMSGQYNSPITKKLDNNYNSQTLLKSNRNFFIKPRDQSCKSSLLPKSIIHDREQLYEEIILVKQELNSIKLDHQKLKTKNLGLEEELSRWQKNHAKSFHSGVMMNSMEAFYKEEKINPVQEKTAFTGELRTQIRDLHKEIEKKDIAMNKLKKNLDYNKHCELEVELETCKRELTRLQYMLGYAMNLKEQEAIHLNGNVDMVQALQNILQVIKQDNIELVTLIKTQEEQIKQINVLKIIDSNLVKTNQTKSGLQRLIVGLQKEVDDMRLRDPFLNQKKSQSNILEKQLQTQLDERISECNSLNNTIQKKDKIIHDLEKKLKDLQTNIAFKIQLHEKEKSVMKESFSEQLISGQNSASNKRHTFVSGQNSILLESKSERDLKDSKDSENEGKANDQFNKRVGKVEVQDIGQQLKYTFLNLRIALNDLDQYIQPLNENGNLTIEELEKCFLTEPFSLNQTDSLKLSRYIVEDNDKKMVQYNSKAEVSQARVKSILRNLMDNYEILSVTGEVSLNKQIGVIFQKYKAALEDAILRIKQSSHEHLGDGMCTISDLLEAFHTLDVQFTQKMCTQVLQKNYQLTNNIKSLNYIVLFGMYKIAPYDGAFRQINSNDTSYAEQPSFVSDGSSPIQKYLKPQNNVEMNRSEKFSPFKPIVINSQKNINVGEQNQATIINKTKVQTPKIIKYDQQSFDDSGEAEISSRLIDSNLLNPQLQEQPKSYNVLLYDEEDEQDQEKEVDNLITQYQSNIRKLNQSIENQISQLDKEEQHSPQKQPEKQYYDQEEIDDQQSHGIYEDEGEGEESNEDQDLNKLKEIHSDQYEDDRLEDA